MTAHTMRAVLLAMAMATANGNNLNTVIKIRHRHMLKDILNPPFLCQGVRFNWGPVQTPSVRIASGRPSSSAAGAMSQRPMQGTRWIRTRAGSVEVENYLFATSQLAQTTLRSVLGAAELDELLSERDEINTKLQEILDRQTDTWGVKVSVVEVKHVDLPQEMQRAMARQAEAERERRAKVIHAEGEFQASQRLAEAAEIMSVSPISLQLRYLQTLTEMTSDKSTTIVVPLPMDLIKPFLAAQEAKIDRTSEG